MTHTELKKFVLHRQPKGDDIITLIEEYNLDGWAVAIDKIPNEPSAYAVMQLPYHWEITFSKEVNE